MNNIYVNLIQILIVIIIGFAYGKLRKIESSFNAMLSNIIFDLLAPVLILSSSLSSTTLRIDDIKNIFLVSILTYGLLYIFAIITNKILKVQGNMKSIAKFSLIFSNVGYVGYPVIKILFGDYMLFMAAIYNVFFRVLLYTVGISLIKSEKTYEHTSPIKMLLNPCSIATFLGVGINMFHIDIKDFFVFNAIESFGNFATSASLLLLGFVISNQKLNEVYKDKKIISICLIKMFIIPIIIGTILIGVFGFQDYILTMIYLIGTPISINLLVFSIKYNQDITDESSTFIVISTMLYFASLPLTSWVISFAKGILF